MPSAILSAIVALAIGGCGGPSTISASDTEPTLLTHDVSGRADEAGFRGYLRHLADADCFVLEPEPGSPHRSIVVWPPGSRVWQRNGTVAGVEVPNVGQVPIGGPISAAGASIERDDPDVDLPDVDPDCITGDGDIAMFHRVNPPG